MEDPPSCWRGDPQPPGVPSSISPLMEYTTLMNIEMIYDPIEVAVGTGLLMDERHEICPESDWLRAVKRTTGRDDLFVYRHKEVGTFVLAQWVYNEEDHGFRVCIELETMAKAPDRGGWIDLEYIKMRCSRESAANNMRAMKNKMKNAKAAKEQARLDALEQRTDSANYQRRKGNKDIAASIESGPYVGDSQSEGMEELKDMLTHAASGKIYTSG